MKARLLVVEDDRDLARGLVFNLEKEGYAVEHAADGRAALKKLESGGFELVVLDLSLPDLDGTDVLQRVRAHASTRATPVICLTARSQETDVVTGLKLGADDYVTKPFGLAQLFARIEAVLRRARPADAADDRLELGAIVVDLAGQRVHRPEGVVELTPIETQLLRYLLARRGRALERAQMLKDLWGVDGRNATRTLDNHVARLRRKIELDPAKPRFLATAHGTGYRFETTSGPRAKP